ncbi:hypothetical protein F511_19969 [Dorcoceras hygrometricum]|uniref:Uncharacterized protein n=1 Tax=Dorcoceras hygrometricum TaxID=472368 RepID=A0A2Z7BUI6_9LAMI|nr:hypothetical protein F511_19969 [Dorcoceras hygrometricum]
MPTMGKQKADVVNKATSSNDLLRIMNKLAQNSSRAGKNSSRAAEKRKLEDNDVGVVTGTAATGAQTSSPPVGIKSTGSSPAPFKPSEPKGPAYLSE